VIGYRLLPPAEEEMTEAALYYEAARSGFGDIFLDDIQHAIDAIRERPEIGATVAYGCRRVLVRRFPFSIVYAVEAESIVIVAVCHQRRRPGYWRGRE
jgi:plasmid stabilization system protein ParE